MKQPKKLTTKTTSAMMRGKHRKALIEAGMYGVFKEKSVPSKKEYSRKKKSNLEGLD